jgi:hypothetical protein
MKRYSTIHPLFMSFYSRSLYQDVGKNWKKISYLYLVLLLAVCQIPIMFMFHAELSEYFHREVPKIIKQVPVITISKGEVSVNVQMPYTIKDTEGNAPLIIIDTTGQVTSLENSEAIALLTKTRLIIRRSSKETRSMDLSGIDSLVIDQSRIYDWIELFLDNFPFLLYPFALLFSFLFRMLQAIIFAAIGMYFAKSLKIPLSYRALLSLAIVSMTPSIILNTLYDYAGTNVSLWWFLNFMIALGYLFFAIKANAGQETGEVVR